MGQQFRIRRSLGFTLVELMMVIVIVAILAAIAVPAFRTMFANNQSVTLSENFIAALNLARSEAIKRGKLVSICRSTNVTDPSPTCANATGDWNSGFLVYVDSKTSETDSSTGIDQLIQVFPSLVEANASIEVERDPDKVDFLRYNSLGALAKTSNADAKVTSSVKGCKGDNKRVMTVKLSGSISVAKQACS